MSINKPSIWVTLLLFVFSSIAFGQNEDEDSDLGVQKIENKISSQFQWRIVLPQKIKNQDTVPYKDFNTKTLFFSIGGNFPIARFLEIQIHPGFSFTKLRFEQTEDKTFPTDSNHVYAYEKIRGVYFTLPIGFQFNLLHDKDNEPALTLEVGASAGIKVGASYKNKLKREDIKIKVPRVDGIEQFRYGAYTQLNYKWIGIVGYYRLSDYFQQDVMYSRDNATGLPQNDAENGYSKYPKVPPIELGLTFDF